MEWLLLKEIREVCKQNHVKLISRDRFNHLMLKRGWAKKADNGHHWLYDVVGVQHYIYTKKEANNEK
jgi:hypothetical protein